MPSAYLLTIRVSAWRNPARCAPPSRCGMLLVKHSIVSWKAVVPGECEFHAYAGCRIVGDRADAGIEHRHLGAIEIFHERTQPALVEQIDLDGCGAWRSSRTTMRRPELRKASSRSRRSRMAKSYSTLVNVPLLGLNVTSVPCGLSDGTDDDQRPHRIAMLEADEMLQPAAPDTHLHPFGQRVDHGRAHAVQPAGHLVGVLVELAACMQPRQHHLGGRDAFLGMHVGGNAAPVVTHGHAAVAVQHQLKRYARSRPAPRRPRCR